MAAKKKNKKAMKKEEVRVPFPVVLANILVLVTVLGLSYMWLYAQCDALGKQIKKKENELVVVEKQLVAVQGQWSQNTSANNLRNAIRRHGLNMNYRRESDNMNVVYDHSATLSSLAIIR